MSEENSLVDSYPIMVSIRCATYNHATYIRQCLDGFVMQQTDYKFEVIVHDDYSTDGTTEIIKEYAAKYPDIIKPMYEEENQYSKNQIEMNEKINSRLRGKYIAICEGDDYWIDPLKLQKQVTFLEENPDFVMVRTNVHRYYQNQDRMELDYFSHSKRIEDTYDFYLMHTLWLGTCTWLFKGELYKFERNNNRKDLFYGDLFLLLKLAQSGKIKYLNDSTAVYRVLGDSSSHFKDWKEWFNFALKCKNTRLLFAVQKPLSFRLKLWVIECIRNSYRAIRTMDLKCMRDALWSTYNDFIKLFVIRKG